MDNKIGDNHTTTFSKKFIFRVFIAGIVTIVVTLVLGVFFKNWTPVFSLILLGALIVVTMFYVYYTMKIADATRIQAEITRQQAEATRQQAEASVRMAKEMREQRYDTFRPVIDIQHAKDGERTLGELAVGKDAIVSAGLNCILHNIGLGPAIDVYSFTQLFSGERYRYDFGSLSISGKSDPTILSFDKESNRNRLLVYCKDVYGREFLSSREVQDRKEGVGGTSWELGPLKITVIDKGEPK